VGHASPDRHRAADPALLKAKPENAYFSRFIPAQHADKAEGMWQRYYRRWHSVTLDQIDAVQIDVVHELLPMGQAGRRQAWLFGAGQRRDPRLLRWPRAT
jgi:hypothetical protein